MFTRVQLIAYCLLLTATRNRLAEASQVAAAESRIRVDNDLAGLRPLPTRRLLTSDTDTSAPEAAESVPEEQLPFESESDYDDYEADQDSEEDSADVEDCDLEQENVDLCQYVQDNSGCTAEEHYIPYLKAYYCTGGAQQWLLFVVYLVWMLLLFYALSEVAEVFLVPAVEWISATMQLPPAVAGVTLLSFAGGAPDLFTQLAAVSTGGAVDLDLAVASTLGSGLFISCVMTASVVLIRTVDVVDTTAFVRDILAYMLANLLVLCFLWNGQLAAWEASLLILLYVVYVAVACYTSRKAPSPEALGGIITTSYGPNRAPVGLTRARASGEQSPLSPYPGPLAPHGSSVRGSLARSWSWHNTGKLTHWLPGFLERIGLKQNATVELPMWQIGSAAKGVDDLETGEELLVMGGRNKQDVEEAYKLQTSSQAGIAPPAVLPTNRAPAHHNKFTTGPEAEADASAEGQSMGLADAAVMSAAAVSNPLRQKSSLWPARETEDDDKQAAARDVIPSLPRVTYSDGDEMTLIKVTDVDGHVGFTLEDKGGAEIVPIFAQEMGFTEQSWRQLATQHLEASFHVYIHLDRKSRLKQAAAIATSPLVLFMHATNPSMHIESFTSMYGYCMAIAAPGFGLATLGLGPPQVHWWGYLLLWAACSSTIAALMYNKLSRTGLGYASRMDATFATISVIMSCVWLDLVASEVVALLQTFGMILDAPTALIGGTILSWGETVPELVATYTLAKMGHSTMAIAGCFAGPVFNLMMGLGLPVLYSSLKHGTLVMELTSGIIMLVVQSVLVLAMLVVTVPLVFKWRLYQQIGFALFGVYVLFQLLFVLVEDGVFW
ncbi:hypothetical protein WJX77_004749 [Trebouxia sp. C0004]